MDFGFSKEEESVRQEVREFLIKELPPGWAKRVFVPNDDIPASDELWAMRRQLAPKLNEKGWQPVSWPKEYGGSGASHIADLIIQEEIYYQGAPARDEFGIGQTGPAIMHFGSEEQKLRHLKLIAKGEVFWCVGYSEPQAGSDLASVQTRAVEDGNDFVINGQKIWTTGAHRADWCLLLVRTDPDAPKHKGLSLFLVDLKTPGITIRPVIDIGGGEHFNEVFYEDVRVPKENLVGGKNQGWRIVMEQLLHERAWIEFSACSRRLLEEVIEYLKESKEDPTKNPLVRQRLAEIAVRTDIARLTCYQIAWLQDEGLDATTQAAMSNLVGTQLMHDASNTAMQLLGLYGELTEGSAWVPLWGSIPHFYLKSFGRIVGSGTNEIQRNLIALRGLGLPRAY